MVYSALGLCVRCVDLFVGDRVCACALVWSRSTLFAYFGVCAAVQTHRGSPVSTELPKAQAHARAKAASAEPARTLDLRRCKLQFGTQAPDHSFELYETVSKMVVFKSTRRLLLRAGVCVCFCVPNPFTPW